MKKNKILIVTVLSGAVAAMAFGQNYPPAQQHYPPAQQQYPPQQQPYPQDQQQYPPQGQQGQYPQQYPQQQYPPDSSQGQYPMTSNGAPPVFPPQQSGTDRCFNRSLPR